MSKSVRDAYRGLRGSALDGVTADSAVVVRPQNGLRQRKQQQMRRRLTEAAVRLFTTRGFDATTVDDIVDAVEVSRRTFFRYFGSKEQVVLAWLDQMGSDLRAALAARPAEEPPFVALRRVLTVLADQYTADRKRTFAIARLISQTPSIRAHHREKLMTWEQGFAEELAARLVAHPHHDLRPRLIASIAVNTLQIAVDTWIADGGRRDLGALVDEAFAIVEGELGCASTIATDRGESSSQVVR